MDDALMRDLIVTAAIIIGFGILVIMFRVERETKVQDYLDRIAQDELRKREDRLLRPDELSPSRIAFADWLIIVSVVLAVVFVVIPLLGLPPALAPKWIPFAAAADVGAVILQLGFIPAILSHYGISIGPRTTVEQRLERNPKEVTFVRVFFALAGVFSLMSLLLRLH